jgi:cell division protein YceG involved in septum cleavage
MTGSWNEIFDKNSKIILGIMIGLIFLLIILLYKLGYFENKRRDEVLNQNYKAVVILKFYDKPNHNTPKIKLSNGKVLIDYWHWRKQKVEIKVGDSLIKEKMSTNLLVKRNSELVYSINLLEVNGN